MTTSASPVVSSSSSSNGASGSSLPRWRLFLQTLNWRRDPDHERKLALIEQRIQDSERRTRQIERDTNQIKSETEQLRELNAKGRQLLSRIDALCFPDGINSTPAPPTAIDSKPSSR
mgnify:CR=1 FL=1